eukprot:TRINITY_DN45909_c0_g1_i1.p1 TRINITY_DN45909_c0_g1~~TRINITY_DN45909_c0_g1_i1.p1  ORF type:complete len:189 (-),score=30.12 TRINITY_DN45909_c0_g1_i1:118-684(-)
MAGPQALCMLPRTFTTRITRKTPCVVFLAALAGVVLLDISELLAAFVGAVSYLVLFRKFGRSLFVEGKSTPKQVECVKGSIAQVAVGQSCGAVTSAAATCFWAFRTSCVAIRQQLSRFLAHGTRWTVAGSRAFVKLWKDSSAEWRSGGRGCYARCCSWCEHAEQSFSTLLDLLGDLTIDLEVTLCCAN